MEAPAGPLAWALPATRFVHFAALTLLFGGLLFPAYTLAKSERRITRPLIAALRVEAWVAVLSAVAVYALGVAGMAGDMGAALDLKMLGQVALGDSFGWLFVARFGTLLLCAGLMLRPVPGAAATWLSGAALAALALTGHAREGDGWKPLLHMPLDALHLLAAGLWIGALPWFAVLLSPAFDPATASAAVRRFSRTAAVAVAVLLLTGVGATLLLVGSPLKLTETTWGRLLIAKVVLAGAMVALAAHNRWRITPSLDAGDPAGAQALRRNAGLELGLALAILALVGVIGTLPFEPMTMPM